MNHQQPVKQKWSVKRTNMISYYRCNKLMLLRQKSCSRCKVRLSDTRSLAGQQTWDNVRLQSFAVNIFLAVAQQTDKFLFLIRYPPFGV